MDSKTKLLKNIFSLSIAEMASKGLAIIYTIYLIKVIGPESNGILNFTKSLVQYFLILVALGYDQVGIREIAKDRLLSKKFVDLIVSIRLFIAFVSFLALVIVVQILILNKPELSQNQHLVYIYGITLFTNAIMLNWYFQAIEQMEVIAIRTIGVYLLNFICIIVLIKSSNDLTLAVVIISASMCINAIIMLIYYLKKYNSFSFNFNLKEWANVSREAFSIGLIFLISTLYNNIDITLLGMFRGDFETGIYGAAHQVIFFAILPSLILQSAFFPQISQKETFQERDNIISKYTKLQSLTAFLVFGYLFFMADYVVVLLGDKYTNTDSILKVLSFTILIQFLISIYFAPLISWKQEKKVVFANLIGLILNIILNIVLIPKYGMYGSAFATILCEFGVLVSIIIIFKKVHAKIYLKEIVQFVPILMLSFLPIYFVSDYLSPILRIISSTVLYFGMSLALKVLSISELKSLIKR
ncbi:MAG TPA: flippase [Candidatus Kapabacteria bacterium]|nr:flippase [Candidatus Kapabacteria bacterium]